MNTHHLNNELANWYQTHSFDVNWQYQVPLLGEGGTCSLFGEFEPEPFDLRINLSEAEQKLVPAAQAIVDWVRSKVAVDWFGVYLKRYNFQGEAVLTKLAYFGAPSRAEFPLSEEFAALSNNSKVGLTGEARVIHDVAAYRAAGGEYYTCDPKVQSELCWPILATDGKDKIQDGNYTQDKILGIIDAECFKTHCFDQQTQAVFKAACQLLSELFTTPPQD